jgi:hypothetical protein
MSRMRARPLVVIVVVEAESEPEGLTVMCGCASVPIKLPASEPLADNVAWAGLATAIANTAAVKRILVVNSWRLI